MNSFVKFNPLPSLHNIFSLTHIFTPTPPATSPFCILLQRRRRADGRSALGRTNLCFDRVCHHRGGMARGWFFPPPQIHPPNLVDLRPASERAREIDNNNTTTTQKNVGSAYCAGPARLDDSLAGIENAIFEAALQESSRRKRAPSQSVRSFRRSS